MRLLPTPQPNSSTRQRSIGRRLHPAEKSDSREPVRVGLRKYRRRIQNFIVDVGSASGGRHTVSGWDSEIALDKPKQILSAARSKECASMIVAEELLKPISDESPCGEDLSYDPGLQELEALARGKEETQFSAAEPPDWKELAVSMFGAIRSIEGSARRNDSHGGFSGARWSARFSGELVADQRVA